MKPRHLSLLAIAAIGLTPAHGGTLEFSFAGTFGTSVGVITAGDTFSGEVTWDSASTVNACPGNKVYAICLPLLTDVLTLPTADGLSIPGATVVFQGFDEVTAGVLDFSTGEIQINVKSSVDGDYYSFYIAPGGLGVTNDHTYATGTAISYTSSGPNAVPEPGSLSLALCALVFPAGWLVRRRWQKPRC